MPKIAKELSAKAVEKKKAPGMHAVGGVPGLHLQISGDQGRSWILRYSFNKKRRDAGLGPYPLVSLAEAREIARDMHRDIRNGIDPIVKRNAARSAQEKEQASKVTFERASTDFLKMKLVEMKNTKHRQQWENTLSQYAYPIIGNMLVDQIEPSDILRVLTPIWQEKTETANRLRGRIERVLEWCKVMKYRSGENPARWKDNLKELLPAPSRISSTKHHQALHRRDIPDFMIELRSRKGIAARAVEFAILTAARSGEVRGATWEEIDLAEKTWTIPAERMKASEEHIVPLSNDAVKLLRSLPRLAGTNLLFPSPNGKSQLSDMTLLKVLRRMEVPATVHGFRSSFKDWSAEETTHSNEVSEMALAHKISNKVEGAYRRGDLLKKRRKLMEDWARYCQSNAVAGDNVVTLRDGA